jgi:hypothetical protein
MNNEGHYELHDLLSQFGAEKLQQAAAETDAHWRHFEWYFGQAEQNELMLNSSEKLKAFVWLIREAANLSEALNWAEINVPEKAYRLAGWMHSDFHGTGVHIFLKQQQLP